MKATYIYKYTLPKLDLKKHPPVATGFCLLYNESFDR